MKLTAIDFRALKGQRPLTMVTCYDSWSAKLLDGTSVDAILVGDSAATVMHGYDSTVHATMEMMEFHTRAVARALKQKFLIGDLPFLSFNGGVAATLENAGRLMRAGAHALKLEGVAGHEDSIRALTQSGIPVMGHLGLTPQSVNQLGGMKVQGRSIPTAQALRDDAKRLEALGCFSVVLECVPASLARSVTESVAIPTIGIGAGRDVDGQVLVLQDLLGLSAGFKPKFLRTFARGQEMVETALKSYVEATQAKTFPAIEESYE